MANSVWWPAIYNERSARAAAHIGGGGLAIASALSAAVILAGVGLQLATIQNSSAVLVCVLLSFPLAYGVWNGSRICAVAALVLSGGGIVYETVRWPSRITVVGLFLLLALIHGVRGTFALQRFRQEKKQAQAERAASGY